MLRALHAQTSPKLHACLVPELRGSFRTDYGEARIASGAHRALYYEALGKVVTEVRQPEARGRFELCSLHLAGMRQPREASGGGEKLEAVDARPGRFLPKPPKDYMRRAKMADYHAIVV